jgi:threonine dehydratase
VRGGQGHPAGIEVIGAQSEAAPAAFRAWRERRPIEDVTGTFAEGLQTRVAFAPAALRLRARLAGRRIALVCCGGNISPHQLQELLAWGAVSR